jgi:hypothetical protein
MNFKDLKKNKSSLAELQKKLEQESSFGTKDERIWAPERDKSGNGYAIIRFLPPTDGEDMPFVKLYNHGFKGDNGAWYIENSLTTLGQQDPIAEHNRELWNSGDGPTIVPTAGVSESNKILVSAKKFLFAGDGMTIFQACAAVLDSSKFYHTDGLILTPNTLPLPQKPGVKFAEQLKWKPAEDNSVDFLVEFDKDQSKIDIVTTGVKPGTGETVQHKSLRLYVGSELDPAY